MMIARTIEECRKARSGLGRLAFVPTMGALHDGHVSLMSQARAQAPKVAVSIFVNPTQFAPTEDLSRYPRPLENDLAKCREAGVDLVFLPTAAEIYPPGAPQIVVNFPTLASVLEGEFRPTHFAGVCQVVAKLFNIVQPEVAVFGQKDFQQLRILTAMVETLDFPIQIVPGPTVRERDGLAMSSRNVYLSPDDRRRARSISQGLFAARDAHAGGERSASALVEIVTRALHAERLAIDYVTAVDPLSLGPLDHVNGPAVIAVAARVGVTRLIDNISL